MRGRVRQRRRQEFPVILFPLPESNLREGCSRSPVLSGILPGCVLRHNCVFAPGRNWAWSSSGCSECPDNGLRHFAGNGRAVFYDDDFEILETLPGQALQKLVHLVGAVVYGNDNGISHVSVSFYRVTGDDAAKIRFYLVIGCCFAAHSDCYFLCTSFFAKFKNENYLSRCHITGV